MWVYRWLPFVRETYAIRAAEKKNTNTQAAAVALASTVTVSTFPSFSSTLESVASRSSYSYRFI